MTLGEKITFLRKQKDWSQPVLGEKVGTSGPIIGRYERDEIKPSIEVAKKIADAFEVSLDYLADTSDKVSLLQDKDMIFRLSKIEKLTPEAKNEILNVVDAYIRDRQTQEAYSK